MEVDNNIFFATVAESLKEGNDVKIVLKGTSMRPTLKEGNTLTLTPVSETPKVGDVVLFRHGGTYLLHRIKAIDGDICTTQGDNCATTERTSLDDIVATLKEVNGSTEWQKGKRWALMRRDMRTLAVRWFGRKGRRRLRPWYFTALAILMWAPLNGLGVPLDNFVLGIRLDHLLHASVFVPCTLFLMDLKGLRRWTVWILAIAISLTCESVQYLLPYRGFDINDMIANVLGVTLGWTIILIYENRRNRRQKDNDTAR